MYVPNQHQNNTDRATNSTRSHSLSCVDRYTHFRFLALLRADREVQLTLNEGQERHEGWEVGESWSFIAAHAASKFHHHEIPTRERKA